MPAADDPTGLIRAAQQRIDDAQRAAMIAAEEHATIIETARLDLARLRTELSTRLLTNIGNS